MSERVLDIGPGDTLWGEEVTDAIDIEDLRQSWPGASDIGDPSKVSFVLGRAEELPYGGETFVVVHAGQVFGAYSRLAPSISEACRVLRLGGTLCLRILGKDVREARRLLRHCGMKVVQSERQEYEDKYSRDWVDIEARKVG